MSSRLLTFLLFFLAQHVNLLGQDLIFFNNNELKVEDYNKSIDFDISANDVYLKYKNGLDNVISLSTNQPEEFNSDLSENKIDESMRGNFHSVQSRDNKSDVKQKGQNSFDKPDKHLTVSGENLCETDFLCFDGQQKSSCFVKEFIIDLDYIKKDYSQKSGQYLRSLSMKLMFQNFDKLVKHLELGDLKICFIYVTDDQLQINGQAIEHVNSTLIISLENNHIVIKKDNPGKEADDVIQRIDPYKKKSILLRFDYLFIKGERYVQSGITITVEKEDPIYLTCLLKVTNQSSWRHSRWLKQLVFKFEPKKRKEYQKVNFMDVSSILIFPRDTTIEKNENSNKNLALFLVNSAQDLGTAPRDQAFDFMKVLRNPDNQIEWDAEIIQPERGKYYSKQKFIEAFEEMLDNKFKSIIKSNKNFKKDFKINLFIHYGGHGSSDTTVDNTSEGKPGILYNYWDFQPLNSSEKMTDSKVELIELLDIINSLYYENFGQEIHFKKFLYVWIFSDACRDVVDVERFSKGGNNNSDEKIIKEIKERFAVKRRETTEFIKTKNYNFNFTFLPTVIEGESAKNYESISKDFYRQPKLIAKNLLELRTVSDIKNYEKEMNSIVESASEIDLNNSNHAIEREKEFYLFKKKN